jgi:hypothetical protein
MVAATVLMAVTAGLVARALEGWLGTKGLTAQLTCGLGPVAAGGLVYAGVALMLRVPEARLLLGAVRRRLPL